MKECEVHPCGAGAGICAGCLAERLSALAKFQNEHASDEIFTSPASAVFFPRSLPPYIASQSRSIDATRVAGLRHLRRFYSTPPASGGRRKRSLLSFLFRRCRSDVNDRPAGGRNRRSWCASVFGGGRSWKQPASDDRFPATAARAMACRRIERGMSPVGGEDESRVSSSCGYSSDSPHGWRRPEPTPVRRPPFSGRRREFGGGGGGGGGGLAASFTVCISPMVWVGPRRAVEVRPYDRRHALGTCTKMRRSGSWKLVTNTRSQ